MISAQYLTRFIFMLLLFGCSTVTLRENHCPNGAGRNPSGIQCESLFTPLRHDHVQSKRGVENNQVERPVIIASTVGTRSPNEVFWRTIMQLGDGDAKIQLSSSEIVLTQDFDAHLKIHSTYTYQKTWNRYIISKIESSLNGSAKKLVSDEPIDPLTSRLKYDLVVNYPVDPKAHRVVSIADFIDYKVYRRILRELPHLQLFTTYELARMNQLPPAARAVKYAALSRARALRHFFMATILADYLYAPVKFLAMTVVSVYIISHVDVVRNLVSKTSVTPNWVAPSIVKMAVAYPESVQPEIVALIQRIEYQARSEQPDAGDVQKLVGNSGAPIKIDEADQFSIEREEKTNKTYFFVSHQHTSGTMEIYATEIDPAQYPNLISYFKSRTQYKKE